MNVPWLCGLMYCCLLGCTTQALRRCGAAALRRTDSRIVRSSRSTKEMQLWTGEEVWGEDGGGGMFSGWAHKDGGARCTTRKRRARSATGRNGCGGREGAGKRAAHLTGHESMASVTTSGSSWPCACRSKGFGLNLSQLGVCSDAGGQAPREAQEAQVGRSAVFLW